MLMCCAEHFKCLASSARSAFLHSSSCSRSVPGRGLHTHIWNAELSRC